MHQTLRHPILLKKILLLNYETQININPSTVGDFNTPLSPTDKSSGQKINRETSELINIIYQVDITDIYRLFYPNTKEFTFYPATHGSFSKIHQIEGHKTNQYKFKKIEITPIPI